MLYLLLKAGISAVIIVAVSEIAKRSPGFGALIASLPLVSVLGMIWLWRDTHDRARMAAHERRRNALSGGCMGGIRWRRCRQGGRR